MLFERVKELVSGLPALKGVAAKRKRGVLKTLQMADVETASSVTCVAGTWARIGKYTVLPQTSQRWGYGREGVTQSNIGILHFLPKNADATPVELPCGVRLAIVDSEDRVRDYVIHNVRSEKLQKDLADGKELVFYLPESGVMAREDDKLVIEINVDADDTYNATASTLRVDTTIYI